jgi:galactokinase
MIFLIKTQPIFSETFGTTAEKLSFLPEGYIEHIDYNDGYVLPAAIDKIICFAFEKTIRINQG